MRLIADGIWGNDSNYLVADLGGYGPSTQIRQIGQLKFIEKDAIHRFYPIPLLEAILT